MAADFVFIGTATETFTPTQSGAIATVMHGHARCAAAEGLQSLVIAQRSDAEPFVDVESVLLGYPEVPDGGLALLARRLERKARGWTRLRQGPWMREVAQTLEERSLVGRPWLVSNEPELVVYLRRRFPHAWIGCWFHNQLPCKPLTRQRLAAAADLFLGVSDFTSDWVAHYYGMQRDSVQTLYNAVASDVFAPASEPVPGPPVIQFVGRTGIEKAPDLLLEACLKLSERTTDFSVRLVGSNHWGRYTEDDYQAKLRRLAGELEARGVKVDLTGHIDRRRLPGLMKTAHIHVTPSRWDEPFGLTTLEGMSCGLATVAGDHGGSPEVLGDAGVRFAREDADDLAHQLGRLVDDSAYRKDVAARCRSRAESMTWDAAWGHLSQILVQAGAPGFVAADVA